MGLIILLIVLTVRCDEYTFGKSVQLVNSGQYHYIASGGYVSMLFSSLSLTNNQYTEASINATLNISIYNGGNTTSNFSYDFLTFPSNNQQASAQFRCYQNYVDLQMNTNMNCTIPNCSPCGSSNQCIAQCFNSGINSACCCSSCSSNYSFQILNNTKFSDLSSNQLVMVFDNSDFLGPYNQVFLALA